MKTAHLDDMIRGWFVGNFEPSLFNTDDMEVAVKKYNAGDYEEIHYRRVVTEITVIISGGVEMNGIRYRENDTIVIEPFGKADFLTIMGTINVVVKVPGANDDKYMEV